MGVGIIKVKRELLHYRNTRNTGIRGITGQLIFEKGILLCELVDFRETRLHEVKERHTECKEFEEGNIDGGFHYNILNRIVQHAQRSKIEPEIKETRVGEH